MKTVVIYKSKTGYTKRYAEWIAQELSADIFEVSQVSPKILTSYDTVIFGGRLYAVGINGVKLITQNLNKLKAKKIVVFATGASLPKEEVIEEVTNKNFTPEQQKYIKFFYMRGGFDFERLPFLDKILMSLMKRIIMSKKKKGKELSSDEVGMLAMFSTPEDHTNVENIVELLNYVRAQ